jgi:hypothetical protein
LRGNKLKLEYSFQMHKYSAQEYLVQEDTSFII